MVPMRMAIAPKIVVGEVKDADIWRTPPTMIMPLIALVTLIRGVWRAGLTFQITCQPTKQASTNTRK